MVDEVDAFWRGTESELDALAERLVEEIRDELPSYAVLPPPEQIRTVREMLGGMVESLRCNELPQPARLQLIRASARRRAYYGMPIYDVLAAFHFAHRGLWETFRASPFASERLLVELVEPMAGWAQAMSQAVVDAYVDQQGGRDAREQDLRAQLFDMIEDPRRAHGAAEVLRELSYDHDGDFTVLVGRRRAWTRDATAALQRAGRRLPGVVQIGARSGLAIVISQGMDIDDILTAARQILEMAPLGIGMARRGIDGIRESIIDATRVLRVAESQNRTAARFEDDWFLAMTMEESERLGVLLDPAGQVTLSNPDLADAVIAFAEAGFSLAGAGQQLRLHANSVSYRLGKWRERTGLDPRVFADLARSIAAISRARSTV